MGLFLRVEVGAVIEVSRLRHGHPFTCKRTEHPTRKD